MGVGQFDFCARYPDPEKQRLEEADTEKQWPTFKGDKQLGNIPCFVWDDRADHNLLTPGADAPKLLEDGATWLRQYNAAAQYRMARFQHHVHTRDAAGARQPLAACAARGECGVCKHDYPKESSCTERPLLVCPGIAQAHGLRISGQRNALGTILGTRNNAWLNGTAQAFVVAFGFNTDTSPNDRLPVMAETHEVSCTRDCLARDSEERVAVATQNAQSLTNGYFGGYMVKVHPSGRYELKKCVDRMFILRERTKLLASPR